MESSHYLEGWMDLDRCAGEWNVLLQPATAASLIGQQLKDQCVLRTSLPLHRRLILDTTIHVKLESPFVEIGRLRLLMHLVRFISAPIPPPINDTVRCRGEKSTSFDSLTTRAIGVQFSSPIDSCQLQPIQARATRELVRTPINIPAVQNNPLTMYPAHEASFGRAANATAAGNLKEAQ